MRRVVACSLVMLLVFLIPVSAEESESVRLNIEIADDNAKPWYGTGERVLLSSSIVNDGGATSISEDPSCGTVMIVSVPRVMLSLTSELHVVDKVVDSMLGLEPPLSTNINGT